MSNTSLNDLNMLLRVIIENKDGCDDDDTLRLAYADELDGIGGEENNKRAEFIRVQCEIERIKRVSGAYDPRVFNPLVHREDALKVWMSSNGLLDGNRLYHRGMVHEFYSNSAHFLKVADQLIWHPSQTVECRGCRGTGDETSDGQGTCGECNGKGKVQRPCPPTAQPIRKVKLTDTPRMDEITYTTRHDYVNDRHIINASSKLDGQIWRVDGTINLWEDQFAQEAHEEGIRETLRRQLHPRVLLPKRFPGVVFDIQKRRYIRET